MKRVCTFCVMDESNPALVFDKLGQCNCCRDALMRMPHEWWPNEEGARRMDRLVASLKDRGKGKSYDVMVGLSGGIDSAYLAHLASQVHGLRVIAVHVDGGWNSEAAVRNIESMVRGLDIDLHTHVIEWNEMRDLQVAFLHSSVMNQDMPQDHAFFATLYRTAARFGMHDFLSGVNFASECVVPPNWGFPSMDGKHLLAIHRRFGKHPLRSYPVMRFSEYVWMTRVRKQLSLHRPLNYVRYDKEAAAAELRRLYGWRDYGGKHCESRFTQFFQEIYLPRKFHFDKRRLHLSSLIVSGQITRANALTQLSQPPFDPARARWDIKFVAKKLGMSTAELAATIESPVVSHFEYPNEMALHRSLSRVRSLARSVISGSGRAPLA